ncbi:hypothetical protein VNO77_05636 [Canavalia gladiata]|uniref:Uncharacterized protein n=1 Tax=Canavalia gladiata TaxID=3824 RepID=A0AAN9MZF8_CANGL
MAGIAYGVSYLAVGAGDGRRRTRVAQFTPNANNDTDTDTDTNTSPSPSEEFTYLNSGKQNVKGLTNQTGYVKGHANGVINFGSLSASAGVQRQP